MHGCQIVLAKGAEKRELTSAKNEKKEACEADEGKSSEKETRRKAAKRGRKKLTVGMQSCRRRKGPRSLFILLVAPIILQHVVQQTFPKTPSSVVSHIALTSEIGRESGASEPSFLKLKVLNAGSLSRFDS